MTSELAPRCRRWPGEDAEDQGSAQMGPSGKGAGGWVSRSAAEAHMLQEAEQGSAAGGLGRMSRVRLCHQGDWKLMKCLKSFGLMSKG